MAKIFPHGDNAYLEGNYYNLKEIGAQLQGYRKFRDGKLFFELSAANITQALKHVPIEDWQLSTQGRARAVIELNIKAKELAALKAAEIDQDDGLFRFKVKPFAHQLKAFKLSKDEKYFAYFMEMGTGKTKVAIDVSSHLYLENKIGLHVVVAPNGVHTQWIEEQLPEHTPDNVPWHGFSYRSGMGKKKKLALEIMMNDRTKLLVVSMNCESLSHASGQEFLEELLTYPLGVMLTIDESSRFKNASSLRTKFMMSTARDADFIRIMSGAPLTRCVEDLYSQFKILKPDILGFNSFYTFRNRYCQMGGYEAKEIVGYKNVKELYEKMAPWSFRALKNDCLDLPPVIPVSEFFDLTPEQRRIMKEIKDDLRTFVGGNDVIAMPLAITRLVKLQQVASGFIIDENKKIHRLMPINKNPRLLKALEIIQSTNEKFLVWARFKEDLKMLSELLTIEGIGHVLYNDDILPRDEKLKQFKENENIRVFCSNQKTGGIGLNITEASYTLYYTNTFDAEDRWQSEARNERSGQKKSVTRIDLLANGSGDKKILNVLKQRKDLSEIVIDGKHLINDIINDLEEV